MHRMNQLKQQLDFLNMIYNSIKNQLTEDQDEILTSLINKLEVEYRNNFYQYGEN